VLLRPDDAAILGGSLRYPNIHVQLLDEKGDVIGDATTDHHGEFRLWNLPTGAYTVSVTTPAAITVEPPLLPVAVGGGYQLLPPMAVTHHTVKFGIALALTTADIAQTDQRQ
jgi:hypothetical protein